MQVGGYVSQALDSEHRTSIDLLGRIEQALMHPNRAAGGDFARLAGAFVRLIEHDIGRHFDFEEDELFPRMADAGEADIAGLLREEHDAIREVAAEVLPLARAAAGGTLDRSGFDDLRRGASELIERQVAHIQKETMALLPLLDDLLDDELDRSLALRYSEA